MLFFFNFSASFSVNKSFQRMVYYHKTLILITYFFPSTVFIWAVVWSVVIMLMPFGLLGFIVSLTVDHFVPRILGPILGFIAKFAMINKNPVCGKARQCRTADSWAHLQVLCNQLKYLLHSMHI